MNNYIDIEHNPIISYRLIRYTMHHPSSKGESTKRLEIKLHVNFTICVKNYHLSTLTRCTLRICSVGIKIMHGAFRLGY